MSTNSTVRRRIGWGVSALAATSAMVAVAAPQAAAGVTWVDVLGTTYTVGSEYTVQYMVEADLGTIFNNRAYFRDNGVCLGSGTGYSPAAKVPSFTWTPATPGSHVITVSVGGKSKSETVTVVAAAPGTPPVQVQESDDCAGDTGSFGSGSSGS
ncbi:hypothetical protein [Nocardia sp. NPDC057668]|uniref:hypothetical protein n=1 Tax=Nocardia sp. NPDC057668 TaxID=3346202 RepID=UPI003670D5AE